MVSGARANAWSSPSRWATGTLDVEGRRVGYLLIVAISVGVGVLVYRATEGLPSREQAERAWGAGEAPAAEPQAPPPPPTNFERLSISHDRLTWHDRMIGTLGLVVAVTVAAAAVAFAIYLAGTAVIALLAQAASYGAGICGVMARRSV